MAKRTVTKNQLALVRAKTQLEKVRKTPRPEVLPALEALVSRELTDIAQVGQLGMQPLKLSDEAEAVLAEPVVDHRVMILPSGAVYYSHIDYTRWFNRAFGRAQWAMVPAALPTKSPIENTGGKRFLCTQQFVLFVHGRPVAQATGEQDYHADNATQSHADVLEGLNASALRRVAKRLGIGLELWDRAWGRDWQSRFAVKVQVAGYDGKAKVQWRRRNDPPFYNERRIDEPAQQTRQVPEQSGSSERPAPPRPTGQRDAETITDPQRKRLWAIASKTGRTEQEIHAYLKLRYAIDSTADITRGAYDHVVAQIESGGPLLEG